MTTDAESEGAVALRDKFAGRRALGKMVAGFAIAGIVVYMLVSVVGWGEVRTALDDAQYRWLAIACLSTLVGLAAWSKAWQVVLAVLDIDVSYRRLVVTYYAATFANYITPLGQAGGEPFIAYVLSQDTKANYEDSLASVVTADLLNLLPFFNFAALGMGFLLLRSSLDDTAETLAIGLVALAVGIPALAVGGWHWRDRVEAGIVRLVTPVAKRTRRVSVEGVRGRIERFYHSLERITNSPQDLLYALVFSYAGWVFFALPLYFAGRTLGIPLDPLVVLFIVPASTLAGMIPLPGGLGGVEVALVVLLLALTPIAGGGAAAIALVYRLASYWFALLAGGVAAVYVIARS